MSQELVCKCGYVPKLEYNPGKGFYPDTWFVICEMCGRETNAWESKEDAVEQWIEEQEGER